MRTARVLIVEAVTIDSERPLFYVGDRDLVANLVIARCVTHIEARVLSRAKDSGDARLEAREGAARARVDLVAAAVALPRTYGLALELTRCVFLAIVQRHRPWQDQDAAPNASNVE